MTVSETPNSTAIEAPVLQDLPNIAIIGRKGSGKTTAAEYLIKRFGYQYDTKEPIVVDGLSYVADYWLMKEQGFVIVRVVAEKQKRRNRLDAEVPEFETLDGYHADHLIYNQDTRDVLYEQLVNVLYREAQRT